MTTKNLIPRASGEGGIGITDVTWGYGYYDTGNFNKGLFVSGHNITQVIAETVTQGGLGGEWTRNGLDIYFNGGNVGIGTSSPARLLHLKNSNSSIAFETPIDANGSAFAQIKSGRDGSSGYSSTLEFATTESTTAVGTFGSNGTGGSGFLTRMLIDSAGNVGIGTTSPTNALNVIRSSTSGVPVAWLHNSNNTTTGNFGTVVSCINNNPSVNVFQVRSNNSTHTNGNGLFTVKGDGNVGIGTTNPSKGIEIVNKQGILIRENQGGLGNQMPLISSSIADRLDQDDWGIAIKSVSETASNGYGIAFWTRNSFTGSSTEKFRIDRVGNVGIGTTDPGAALDVAGSFKLNNTGGGTLYPTSNDVYKNGTTSSLKHSIILNTAGWRNASVIESVTGTAPSGFSTEGLYLNATYGSNVFTSASVHVDCNTGNGDISFLTGTGAAAPTTKFKLQNNGNVGIGTTNPFGKLEVQGSNADGDVRLSVANTSNGQDAFTLLLLGNDEYTTGSAGFRRYSSTHPKASVFDIANLEVGKHITFSTRSGTDPEERMRIDASGNVGIGTTNPDPYKLNVNGNVFASSYTPTSDDRVKHNEQLIVGALETLSKITPKKYIKTVEMYDANHDFALDANGNPVDKDGKPVEHRIEAGVIAQQVLTVDELAFAVSPEGVDEDGKVTSPHGLDYNSLFTYAIAAIQEQQQLIEDLKSRIETLENK